MIFSPERNMVNPVQAFLAYKNVLKNINQAIGVVRYAAVCSSRMNRQYWLLIRFEQNLPGT